MVHPEGAIQHQMLDILSEWSDQLNTPDAYNFDPF